MEVSLFFGVSLANKNFKINWTKHLLNNKHSNMYKMYLKRRNLMSNSLGQIKLSSSKFSVARRKYVQSKNQTPKNNGSTDETPNNKHQRM